MTTYNPDLVYQVVRARLLNKRRPIASTKDRSEVSGGGRKPWPQKGTGRARHGSIRSPLWRGGGITFGPRSKRNYRKDIPKKIGKQAFKMVLEKKREEGELILVDKMSLPEPKTKLLANWLIPLVKGGSSLVVPDGESALMKQAGRNVPRVKVVEPEQVSIIAVTYTHLTLPTTPYV